MLRPRQFLAISLTGQIRDGLKGDRMATASAASITALLKKKGTEQMCEMYARHGMPKDRAYGVSMADLKVIAKTIKGRQALAVELYQTGNLDAMYLAGMVADGKKMSAKELHSWADAAAGMSMISEYTVPWVAVEHPEARKLATKWIASKKDHVASAGWCTYSGIVAVTADDALDHGEIEKLLKHVVQEVHTAPNRVRANMNGFLIAVGTYVPPLLPQAKRAAKEIGEVTVDMGDTACVVRLATESIAKAEKSGKLGRKRKTIRC